MTRIADLWMMRIIGRREMPITPRREMRIVRSRVAPGIGRWEMPITARREMRIARSRVAPGSRTNRHACWLSPVPYPL
jgi:hypothetical protein